MPLVVGGALYYMFMMLGTVQRERRDSREHIVLDRPLHTIAFILLSLVQIDPSYSSIGALRPVDNNNAAICARCTFNTRRVQKTSIPKHDGQTYVHTYRQTQNEMRSRISCLALRHSAIIANCMIVNIINSSSHLILASYPGSRGRRKESLVSIACACA